MIVNCLNCSFQLFDSQSTDARISLCFCDNPTYMSFTNNKGKIFVDYVNARIKNTKLCAVYYFYASDGFEILDTRLVIYKGSEIIVSIETDYSNFNFNFINNLLLLV